MGYIQLLDVLFISTFIAYLVTPFIRTVATKFGYLDNPQDNKVHAHPTPLLGGLAIFSAFLIAILTKESVIGLTQARAMLLGVSLKVKQSIVETHA